MRSTLLSVLALAAGALPAFAWQAPRTTVRVESCAGCRIQIDTVVVLGDLDGEGSLVELENFVHMDSRGRYYQSDGSSPFLTVFGPDGTYLRRIGRQGEGPGELLRVTAVVVAPGDSLIVFDRGNARVSLFDPAGNFVTSSPVPTGINWDGIHDRGGVLVNGHVRTSEFVGLPLFRVSARGGVLAAFGADQADYRPDLPNWSRRVIGKGDGGSWVGWLSQYVFELWNAENELVRVVERQAEWFPPYWTSPEIDLSTPPTTLVRGVWQVGNLLWTIVRTADPRWEEVVTPFEEGRPGMFLVEDYSRYYDSIIEVIDLSTGSVLASQRYDEALRSFLGDGLTYATVSDELGVPRILVLRLSLVRSG